MFKLCCECGIRRVWKYVPATQSKLFSGQNSYLNSNFAIAKSKVTVKFRNMHVCTFTNPKIEVIILNDVIISVTDITFLRDNCKTGKLLWLLHKTHWRLTQTSV